MAGRMRRAGILGGLAAVLAVLLSACYVPNDFVSEIRINRNGAFGMMYQGELVWAPLYEEIRFNRLEPAEQNEKIAGIEADLKRDGNFKVVQSLGMARFKVRYDREGMLKDSQQVTFIRRNARILHIKSAKDGLITVVGTSLRPSDRQRLIQSGMTVNGEFRVTTNAAVKEHNANEVRQYMGYQVYIWRIDSPLAPTPKIVMQRV